MTASIEVPHVLVGGEAERAVLQDRITLHLRVSETAETPQAARQLAIAHGAQALDALKPVPARNLQAAPVKVSRRDHDLRVHDKRQGPPSPEQTRTDYVAVKTIIARYEIEDGRAALRALKGLESAVTLDVSEFSISAARQKETRRELLTEAVADAREVADILAAAASETVSGVLRIDEPRQGAGDRQYASLTAASFGNGPEQDESVLDDEFEAGYATISVRVSVAYSLTRG